ncbi:MAG: metallophosphoesterase [Akkermansiaceae bacterium]
MKFSRALPLLAATALVGCLLLTNHQGMADEVKTVNSEPSEEFTFIQMCDTQLGMGGYEHDVKTFELAVDQINAMAPDFVLICGDLVGKANEKSFADFNRIKSGFTIPCHCAAGNHDVGNKPTTDSLENYRKQIGKDYFTLQHKGYTFVIANTQLWKAPLEDESEKHDAWFKAALKSAKEKGSPVVVVTHYPLFVTAPDEKENYYNIEPTKRKELLDLFKSNGVVAMLAGHTHKLVVNDYQGIQMVNGETTSKNFDKRSLGFRKWTAKKEGELSHEYVKLTGKIPGK